jgi:polyketide synthase PksM
LSSVKTNIGHLETAAGIASAIKASLAIRRKQIPASIHFEDLNPYINLKGTPFYIADKLISWEVPIGEDGSPAPRVAGVSSFGFGGVNAHVVLEEYLPPKRLSRVQTQEPQLIVLSAKNEDRLKAYAQSMLAYLEKAEIEPADFAYTLQVGRDEMPERLAVIASSVADIRQKFKNFLTGAAQPASVYRGNAGNRDLRSSTANDAEGDTFVQALIERKELSRLAELWVSGGKIDWEALYGAAMPMRLSLPTYPFAKESHWPSGAESLDAEPRRHQVAIATAALHPLVHRNVSTLEEQKFASRFSGEEFYFDDHRVEGRKVLPGVAYLEMARAAGALSGNAKVRCIRNVTWERPFVVGSDAAEVEISLTPVRNEVSFSVKTVGKEQPTTHCRGKLSYSADTPPLEALDIAAIRSRCAEQVMSGEELYGAFLRSAGLELGGSFQVAQQIYANESESLAILLLPEHLRKEVDQFELHPALMEGALHSGFGLIKKRGLDAQLSLPFSVGEGRIFHPLRDLYYGYATWADDRSQSRQDNRKLNIHLLDKDGTVLASIRDFALRPLYRDTTRTIPRASADQPRPATGREEITTGLQSVVPVWNSVRLDASERITLPESTGILLASLAQPHLEWVRKHYPNSHLLPVASTSSVDSIAGTLRDCAFDQLLWIAPDVTRDDGARGDGAELIIDQQKQGALAVFRIIKALLQSEYANKKLQWTIITGRTQQVTAGAPIQPAHAGIVGLIGSLAKEYPHWDLRLLDLDSLASVSAQECLSLPWDKQGEVLAHRQGKWFRPGLARMGALPEAPPVYRQNGVYVVIGGAGGVGEVWSRYMIEHYQANIVWIGRREYDAAIGEKIKALARLGNAPMYISADATDVAALERARRKILETHPAIHGVVHSAIVLRDQSISRMDESAFKSTLSAKVDASVNIDRVFGDQDLDFMLFFSSMISFIKSAGQCNYSAGCTFKDSFAQRLRQERPYPVKIINWGYWGSVGIVADEGHNRLMAQLGIASIEPQEGMASLQALLASGAPQMGLIKTLNSEATANLRLSEVVTYYPKAAPALPPPLQSVRAERDSATSLAALEREAPTAEMNDLLTEILASSLKSLGLFSPGAHQVAGQAFGKASAPYYEQWLGVSASYLQKQGLLGDDLTFNREVRTLPDLWDEWEMKRAAWAANPGLQAYIALLDVCLKALPDILSGKRRATDVMFPNSSLRLVEEAYSGNAVANYFNEALRETLISCLEHQSQADRNRRFRILEIGAGTGGATASLLPVLQRFPIEEYCYTDVSKAFLMHAEKNYLPQFPALTTAIFDVSMPVVGQSIATNYYDFAIAANVLHATPDIRQAVRNAKAALKNQGILLLGEISAWSLFFHVTFGLLEGWWLCEDKALRLPGSPGLAPEKWREILAEEGFESIFFPVEGAHRFGQQIVVAASDGWARQRLANSGAPQLAASLKQDGDAAATPNKRTDDVSSPSAELAGRTGENYIRRIITQTLSEGLKLDAAAIRNDDPFAEYGVDSIIGVNLVRTINETLQIDLDTTKLFEYTTVNQLTRHIWTEWRERIVGRLPDVQGAPLRLGQSNGQAPTDPYAGTKRRFKSKEPLIEAGAAFNGDESDSGEINMDAIAVVGMSGRFAESESLEEFWQNLKNGKDMVRRVSRWSATDCVFTESAGARYCSDGGFVDSIDQFDPSFFRIPPHEALYMDPQQRLFLEESWKAMEDAGYAGKSAHEKRCGIYVGCGSSGYGSLFGKDRPPHAFWGNSESIIPARIAYYLDLQGPAVAIDTACSSSLIAIHMACQGLWSREIDMALAGGVFLQSTPEFYRAANHARMLSPDGKCYSFDERANGFAPGEGVGVVALKRLPDALADGDHIHGVIAGSGINQNGSSNGLIAPNARAQERLECSVYDRFKINPETIQVVEAHGTGTLLGDSIEYGALSRAFSKYTDRKQFCAIGAVKTNIGHTAMASGIAGVLKLLLSLKHRQIPPSLHFRKANPDIVFESGPFYVNTELTEWTVEDNQARRAAVSVFGFSGANAHLVIEEAPLIERSPIEAPGYVVVLSARTPEQLKRQAVNLLDLLRKTPDMSMNDLSFTLFVGRLHLSHRLACLARNQEELVQILDQWLEIGTADQVYSSEIQEGKSRERVSLKKLGNRLIQECENATDAEYLENLAAIADFYVQGYSLDYHTLFPKGSRRIPLPTYPFSRERYWLEAAPAESGNICFEARESSSQADCVATETAIQAEWLFSTEQSSYPGIPMGTAEKIELFLRQETALQLRKPIDQLSTDQSYSDLGLTSLAAIDLIQKTNRLLDTDLSPSLLFEYTNIRSLAAHLAITYPARIAALTVVRREDFLEKVLWRESSLDKGYEKVAF